MPKTKILLLLRIEKVTSNIISIEVCVFNNELKPDFIHFKKNAKQEQKLNGYIWMFLGRF